MNRFAVVAAAVVLGAGLVVGAGLPLWDERESRAPVVLAEETGADPGCGELVVARVGSSDHIDEDPITYAAVPPAAGDHRSRWAYFSRNFYEVADRPEVGELVHNLEHGYNILWYDETVAEDAALLARVRTVAESYDGARRDPGTAFIAAPWTVADGPSFPEGMRFALTHWYADPDDRTRSRSDERGLTQYCRDLSPDAVEQWMDDYPLSDSPEGFPANM